MKVSNLTLCDGNIVVTIEGGSGSITSELHDTCQFCGEANCYYSCDQSTAVFDGEEDETESEEDVDSRKCHNHFVDGVESLILALACGGFDVEDKKFQFAVQTALDAWANN